MPTQSSHTSEQNVDCEIRRAAAADVTRIAEISRAARNEISPGIGELHTVQEDRDFFTGLLNREKVVVAEVEGEVVAFISSDTEMISQFYVDENFRGRGIGSHLLNEVLQNCSDEISLWCFEVNRRALKFYFKNGFVPLQHADGSNNDEKLPDVRLGWHRDTGCLVRSGRVDLDWFAQHDGEWRELGIAAPARRALISNDIRNVQELREVSLKDVAKFHGMGPSTLTVLQKFYA